MQKKMARRIPRFSQIEIAISVEIKHIKRI